MTALFIFLGVAFFLCYRSFSFVNNFAFTVLFKTLCSACFVGLAIYFYFQTKEKSVKFKRYSIKIIIALSASLLADVLIRFSTVAGILGFMLAQIFFFLSFYEFKKISLRYIIIVVAVVGITLALDWFCPVLDIKKLLVPIIIYAFCVVGSAMKSIDALSLKDKFSRIVVAAGILFLLSDLSLQFTISEISSVGPLALEIINIASNILYYVAQFLFAYSLSKDFFNKEEES